MEKLLIVGDTHGNPMWWKNGVEVIAGELDCTGIIQVGDFGWWPPHQGMVELARACQWPVWFLKGNHENQDDLDKLVEEAGGSRTPVPVGGSLTYMPTGSKLVLEGVTMGFVGGAHSIDKQLRVEGVDWFPQEDITSEDIDSCQGLSAKIMFSHDAPSGWVIPGLSPDWKLPPAWRAELSACSASRQNLRACYELVKPEILVHGHYHSAYRHVHEEDWGHVDAWGLACDGQGGNMLTITLDNGTIDVQPVQYRMT